MDYEQFTVIFILCCGTFECFVVYEIRFINVNKLFACVPYEQFSTLVLFLLVVELFFPASHWDCLMLFFFFFSGCDLFVCVNFDSLVKSVRINFLMKSTQKIFATFFCCCSSDAYKNFEGKVLVFLQLFISTEFDRLQKFFFFSFTFFIFIFSSQCCTHWTTSWLFFVFLTFVQNLYRNIFLLWKFNDATFLNS